MRSKLQMDRLNALFDDLSLDDTKKRSKSRRRKSKSKRRRKSKRKSKRRRKSRRRSFGNADLVGFVDIDGYNKQRFFTRDPWSYALPVHFGSADPLAQSGAFLKLFSTSGTHNKPAIMKKRKRRTSKKK